MSPSTCPRKKAKYCFVVYHQSLLAAFLVALPSKAAAFASEDHTAKRGHGYTHTHPIAQGLV